MVYGHFIFVPILVTDPPPPKLPIWSPISVLLRPCKQLKSSASVGRLLVIYHNMEAPTVLNLVVSIAILLTWTAYRWFGKLSTNPKGNQFATTEDAKPGGLRDVVATLDGSWEVGCFWDWARLVRAMMDPARRKKTSSPGRSLFGPFYQKISASLSAKTFTNLL